jgi:hypothetical protein
VRNAARLLPSGVHTLIRRPVPPACLSRPRTTWRRGDPRSELQSQGSSLDQGASWLRRGGLHPDGSRGVAGDRRSVGATRGYAPGSPADYRFTHNQIREFAAAMLTAARRRAIHRAIVDMLSASGEPSPESMSLLSHHALAGDDPERAVRFSISAAKAALESQAAEETLRVVDQALPAASAAHDRVALLHPRTTHWECYVARPTGRRPRRAGRAGGGPGRLPPRARRQAASGRRAACIRGRGPGR